MREDDARNLLLVRAIEREDADGDLLTEEDRRRADAAGRAARSEGRKGDTRYLAARAKFAAARIATRHPAVGSALAASRWPGWTGWAVPLAAFVIGAAANEIGNGRRLDLLALPLLGTLAWNLAVYLWILAMPLVALRRRGTPALRLPLPARLTALARKRFGTATPVARALGQFAADWTRAASRLTAARAARVLHTGAAAFALGVIAGIYLRGLAIEYRAGWESTFLGPGAVHAILSALLAPASAVTGIAVPDVIAIADLRWREHNGGEAAPWIHLYVALLALVVVAPRAVLAIWQAVRGKALALSVPVPGREDFYVRRLLRQAGGDTTAIRVTAYAFRPDAARRDRLAVLARAALGDATRIHFDEAIDYGAEEAWLAAMTPHAGDDHHLLLFTASATPEDENHGALARGLAAKLAGSGTALAAILDTGAIRTRFAGEARLDERLATRRRAWEAILAPAGIAPLAIDLAADDPADVSRIEAALVSGAGLEGGR